MSYFTAKMHQIRFRLHFKHSGGKEEGQRREGEEGKGEEEDGKEGLCSCKNSLKYGLVYSIVHVINGVKS